MSSRLPQLFRRVLQVSVFLFIAYAAAGGPWRNYKVAHNHRRLVSLIHGDNWGQAYGANEDMLSWFGEPYEMSKTMLGFPWAARVFGLDTVDPVLALAHIVDSGKLPLAFLAGTILPLLIAVLFGKVFCSHLCPMRLLFELGQGVRAGLVKLGVPLPDVRPKQRFGGWVLLGGLIATAIAGTGVWFLILPYVALGMGVYATFASGSLSMMLWLPIAWFVLEIAVAPGLFCHHLCPTGFLLEQVGRKSLLKLVKEGEEACPKGCRICSEVCPYHLSPRERTHHPACDNCGRCVPACPGIRLSRKLPILAAVLLACGLTLPSGAQAHHNKGMPHYGYYENYAQVPTDEYVVIEGKWEFGVTIFNFQGLERRNSDTPNDVKLFCYLYNLEADAAHVGGADFEIRHDGEIITQFTRHVVDEEAIYSTRETLPESGEYELVATVQGQRVVIPFYVDLASDRIRWWLVAAILLPVMGLFLLALVGRRRKLRRRKKRVGPAASSAASLLLLLCASLGLPALAPIAHAQETAAEHAEHAGSVGQASGEAEGVMCPHCGMIDCTMQHYEVKGGGSVMVMGGIPLWLFLTGVGSLILLTFVGTEWLAPKVGKGFRINLIGNKRVYAMVRSRWFQAVPQLIAIVALCGLIYAGLFGSNVRNVAPVAVWTVWWAGLVFLVLFFASTWCLVCPWDGIASIVSRLSIAKKRESLSLGLSYPKWAQNMYPAIALFVVLTWLELGYGVTTNARMTAMMALGMVAMAVASALLWDDKRFCSHVCPVGRICGIYSNFAPIEIRGKRESVCQKCKTEDCLNGKDEGYACPTGISLKTITDATMCTNCTECIKSCVKQNIAVNLRPFGADLRAPTRVPRMDEAWMAVCLLSLTLFHGLSMTPAWESFAPGGQSILKWMSLTFGMPHAFNFTVGMIVAAGIPVGLYWLCCWLSSRWAQGGVTTQTLFRSYAYSLLPVALFYHLAHNLMHILMEGGEIVPLLSDPLGHGDDFFGTAKMHIGSLVTDEVLWFAQVSLILVGHVYGILIAHRIGHSLYRDRKSAWRSLSTVPVMMIMISVCGLWLMHMDMNMRTGRM